MADFSFSLYLVHFPILVWILSLSSFWIESPIQMQPTPRAFAIFTAVAAVLYLLASLFWFLFERHHQAIRNILMLGLAKFGIVRSRTTF
jgi:peptidoglycan/LPS O-acetylase OafA/YrhL